VVPATAELPMSPNHSTIVLKVMMPAVGILILPTARASGRRVPVTTSAEAQSRNKELEERRPYRPPFLLPDNYILRMSGSPSAPEPGEPKTTKRTHFGVHGLPKGSASNSDLERSDIS
jgi:hypothetical protein